MPNWQTDSMRTDDRELQRRRAMTLPFGMLAQTISSYDETAKFNYFGGRDRKIAIIHPFMSANSWIRGMPEEGSVFLGTMRSDEAKPQPITTIQRSASEKLETYRAKQALYRELFPGEIELHSLGAGQLFLPRRPKAELRGGILTRWIDQDRLEVGDRSPIHRRQFFLNRANILGDEERVGLVTRPKKRDNADADASVAAGGTSFSNWQLAYPKVRNNWAAEWYMNLKSPGKTTPEVLFTIQKGHVLDEKGEQIEQTITQIPLRSYEEYFANDDSSTKSEIDEKGNWYMELTSAAIEGFQMDIKGGNYKKNVELDEEIAVNRNSKHVTAKSRILEVGGNLKINVVKNVQIGSEDNGSLMVWDSTAGSEQVVWRSKSGHIFNLNDTSGKESVHIIHNKGHRLVLGSDGSVKMAATNGANLALDATNDAITAIAPSGAFVTLSDVITISDSTGGQVITFNGEDKIQITANSIVNLSAPNVTIGGGSVNIGNLASLSAVLAEPLAILFDSHTHAAPLGPTSPPIPPNTAAILNANPTTSFASAYVKMRTNVA